MPKLLKISIKYILAFLIIALTVFNFKGILRFLRKTAVVSAYINTSPFFVTNAFYVKDEPNKTQTEKEVINESLTENTKEKTGSKAKTTKKAKAKKVTEASTKGKVLGKVNRVDLSNSGANTSYKNIYFNNNTGTSINIKQLLESELSFNAKSNSEPQVLIYHTHSTECYMNEQRNYYTEKDKTRTTDKTENMIAVGNVLAKEIEKYGYKVLHSTELHDYPSYTGSYSNSAKTVNNYLNKYPSIKIIIDLHRDSIGTTAQKTAPTKTINGKSAAQVMLVMGSNTGFIDNYPNWKENLKLATKLQQTFNNKYPGLSRALLLRSSLYNQNLSKGAMLIEIGTEANTLEEAKYSAKLVGRSIATVMKGTEK